LPRAAARMLLRSPEPAHCTSDVSKSQSRILKPSV
jgi:hypothetical protein